jgi:hypothetical protein
VRGELAQAFEHFANQPANHESKREMKRALIILAMAGVTSIQAKTYYFNDLTGDFPIQPEVEKCTSSFGVPYTQYSVDRRDEAFIVAVFSGKTPDIEKSLTYGYGMAKARSVDGKVYKYKGVFKGNPSMCYVYKTETAGIKSSVIEFYVFTPTRSFMITSVSKPDTFEAASRRFDQFLSTLDLKEPSFRDIEALPITNGDTVGEL